MQDTCTRSVYNTESMQKMVCMEGSLSGTRTCCFAQSTSESNSTVAGVISYTGPIHTRRVTYNCVRETEQIVEYHTNLYPYTIAKMIYVKLTCYSAVIFHVSDINRMQTADGIRNYSYSLATPAHF